MTPLSTPDPSNAETLPTPEEPGLWQNVQFRIYLGTTALAGNAASIQQLLLSWLMVGILLLPADQVGIIQALIGIPGILLMLWGGASADKTDSRSLLIWVYATSWLFPMALFFADRIDLLNIWTVALFGVAMGTALFFSNPAQQAILNRIAGSHVQRGVTAATAMQFLVQILGLIIAGQMETIGVGFVLIVQSISLVLGAIAVTWIKPLPVNPKPERRSTMAVMLEGFKAAYENKTIFHTLIVTFTSGIFNAGAFMTALPFIVKRAYDGDALGLATIMIVFYLGATISNVIQFWIMPLARPGFWFLAMQFTRIIILFFVWIQPGWFALMAVLFAWGLNMGVTTNLSRALVQESAEQAYLARVLSVYNLGMLGSMPIGALIIGFIIEAFGTMNAMVPAMIVSAALCVYGFLFTGLATYRSPGFERA
ncbi:MAG: MFS transporter [Pseudomonadales bacterium]|nr:MFS transporter [Pseudomonadales bacterium]